MLDSHPGKKVGMKVIIEHLLGASPSAYWFSLNLHVNAGSGHSHLTPCTFEETGAQRGQVSFLRPHSQGMLVQA